MKTAPQGVVTRRWRPYVRSGAGDLDRMPYTYCVLDQLTDALRRREVFVTSSIRYADPRLGMLEGKAWEAERPRVCRTFGRSADGRVDGVPIQTVYAGPNIRYFPRNTCGITLYNLMSNQYTGLNGIVVTGTLRDSLVLVSLLLGQQTTLQPTEIMTDTGAYSDVIFGLLWLLGYQFSPRISDIGGVRFWRVDRAADYGPLNNLAIHTIHTALISTQWDELLRLIGSLTFSNVQIDTVVRTLQRGNTRTKLA